MFVERPAELGVAGGQSLLSGSVKWGVECAPKVDSDPPLEVGLFSGQGVDLADGFLRSRERPAIEVVVFSHVVSLRWNGQRFNG